MRHVRTITRVPQRAQSSLCTSIDNDFQAQLCLVLEILTTFVLPIIGYKQPEETTS